MIFRWINRIALPALLCSLFILPAHGARKSKGTPPAPPNIILLMGDDHAAYAMGAYGSPFARTPNLDRLAAGSALFQRAYCNAPVCTASRQSLLTGRLPSATGVTLLKGVLREEELTMADYLKSAGYITAAIGKMHFNSALKHGFDTRIDTQDYNRWIAAKTKAPVPAGVPTLGPWRPMADPANEWLNADVKPLPLHDADMEATFFVTEALKFIRESGDRPYFLIVSLTQPHSPFHFPIEFAGKYKPEEFPVPPIYPEDPPLIPLVFRNMSDAHIKGINAAYYTSVEYLDSKMGQILNEIDQPDHSKRTMVVYTSDHGYTLGHHGRFEKHSFWEQSVQVPLLIRFPGKINPKRVNALTELVDLFPTVAEAAGLSTPPMRHGRSLWPVLRGQMLDQELRDHLVAQYHENEEAMVRTERYKLIYCSGRRSREDGYRTSDPAPGRYMKLYDLLLDPNETEDLSSNPHHAERVVAMKGLLLNRLEEVLPMARRAPERLSREEKLDYYLVPPEVRAEYEKR